jgi:hypothetical protein
MINSISGKLKSLPFVKIDNKEVEKHIINGYKAL